MYCRPTCFIGFMIIVPHGHVCCTSYVFLHACTMSCRNWDFYYCIYC